MAQNIYYFHDRSKKSTTTCAYILNLADNIVQYGATVFKRENNNEVWNRKKHLAKARQRLKHNPVTLNFKNIKSKPHFHQYRRLESYIRTCISRFGVEGGYHWVEKSHTDMIFTTRLTKREIMADLDFYYDKCQDDGREEYGDERCNTILEVYAKTYGALMLSAYGYLVLRAIFG